MASSLSQLSASVTRILSLTGFPKELKTRDIQLAFSDWENASGGFKIKWIDDTSLLVVFADAAVGEPSFPLGLLFFFGPLLSPALTVMVYIQLSGRISLSSQTHLQYSRLLHQTALPSFVRTTGQMPKRSFRMSTHGDKTQPVGTTVVLYPLRLRASALGATGTAPALAVFQLG